MLRLGLVGAGAIAEKHAQAAAAAETQIVRVVDHDLSRAEALASAYHATSSADVATMFSDGEVDAVVIAVPNKFHKPLALEAMHAGKDVLLEKPMALSTAECDELVAAASATGRVLQIGFVHRFTAVAKAARTLIAAEKLGDIRHAKAHLLLRRAIPGLGGWFTTKAIAGGGCLIDLGVHLVDLVLHLLGHPKVELVSGKTYHTFGSRMRDYRFESMWAGPPNYDGVCDVEDSAFAMVQLANDVTLDLQVAWACNLPEDNGPGSTIAFMGDRGGLSFELFGESLRLRTETSGYNAESKLALPPVDQMAAQLADFRIAIEQRAHQVGASPAQGRQVQQVVDAIYAASDQNAPITLSGAD